MPLWPSLLAPSTKTVEPVPDRDLIALETISSSSANIIAEASSMLIESGSGEANGDLQSSDGLDSTALLTAGEVWRWMPSKSYNSFSSLSRRSVLLSDRALIESEALSWLKLSRGARDHALDVQLDFRSCALSVALDDEDGIPIGDLDAPVP
jgi:hypothetical protein